MAGVKSTALLFGDRTKHWLSGFGAIVISGLAITGKMVNQTWPYYFALTITALQLSWQIGFVNINDPKDCWNKFASNRVRNFKHFTVFFHLFFARRKNCSFLVVRSDTFLWNYCW